MFKQTHIIVGMGEIGSAFYEVLKTHINVMGIDLDPAKCKGTVGKDVDVMNICIPYLAFDPFNKIVMDYASQYKPKELIIHSSVEVGTTEKIMKNIPEIMIAYSPFRGVHSRMMFDMKRYTKYWAALKPPKLFVETLQKCRVPTKEWKDAPHSLELAKLMMDVTYYGWLIIWSQIVRDQAYRYNVKPEQLWEFTDEIHKFLGNRPRLFFGEGIGGHCVHQDRRLLNNAFLDSVFNFDEYYRRNLERYKTNG